MQHNYLETTKNVYKEAAENPQQGLCCTTTPAGQLPLAVCDKTADTLNSLKRKDIYISASTWFYDGGGCC